MTRKNNETRQLSATERDIDRAIERIYNTYGTNLAAFFSAVQQKRQVEPGPRGREREQPKTEQPKATH